jgi:transposase
MVRKELTNVDRKRIIDAYLTGNSMTSISELFKVHKSTVSRIIKAYVDENRYKRKPKGGIRRKSLNDVQKETIKGLVEDNCGLTLREIKQICMEVWEISVSEKNN